jgi:hypothetical protein
MNEDRLQYSPIPGKTYSLFGHHSSTEDYFGLISQLADECVQRFHDNTALLEKLRDFSGKKRTLRRAREGVGDPELVSLLGRISPSLSEYTVYLQKHLDEMPFYKFWDRRLRTSEEQYHLYMLEIELTNRANIDSFRRCGRKIALLPYCLQDWSGSCKSSMGDFDYVCRKCSKKCYINRVTSLLKEHEVSAYIWMSGDLKKLKSISKSGNRLGGLGIACIPELVHGLRSSAELGIAVVGLPLDANRCIRWTGTFYQNSVNLAQLARLVNQDQI